MNTLEYAIRLVVFDWLTEQVRIHGRVLPRKLLEEGLVHSGTRIPLLGPQGIWKPKIFSDTPLSITTTSDGPYNDSLDSNGLLSYRYRGNDPYHRDNVGLRRAILESVPLIYFMGVAPGRYYAAWPSYVVSDDPKQLTFTVAIDDAAYLHKESTNALLHDDDASSRRRYITALTRQRLHQQGFREKVLYAYQRQCACCRLRHEELLDAAHIIPDSDPEGIPSINNGISLCKLHHAAFDSFLIGITPDYHVQVRLDVLNENDGPMLLHGLKNLSGQKIILPKSSQSFPSVELLEKKFEQFRRAG